MYSSHRRLGHSYTRRRHGHHGHRHGSPARNGTNNFLLNILLLSIIFDNSNSIGARILSALFVITIISLVIYGIYAGAKYAEEKFTNSSNDLTPADNEVVVALFYADWCGHCKHFKPEFDKVSDEINGEKCSKSNKKLRIVKVDCSNDSSVSNKYNVQGFPTVKILGTSDGETEYTGERTYDSLKSYLLEL